MREILAHKGPDRELSLHYIDKLYDTLGRTWTLSSRIALLETVLSLIFLAFSTNLLSPPTKHASATITILNLPLSATFSAFLCGGAVLVTTLAVSYWTVESKADQLRDQIHQQYKSLGFDEQSMHDLARSPFENPSLFNIVISRTFARRGTSSSRIVDHFDRVVGIFALIVLVILLPMGTPIAIGLKVESLLTQQGPPWWVRPFWTTLSIIVFASFASYIFRASQTPSNSHEP